MKTINLFFLLLFVTACAGTGAKNKLGKDVAKRLFDFWYKHTQEIPDNQIASVADKKPQLPKPFALAVYFKQPGKKEYWRFTREDKDLILDAIATQKKSVKKSFELINTSGSDEESKSLRLMAAQQGASDVESDLNGMATT